MDVIYEKSKTSVVTGVDWIN